MSLKCKSGLVLHQFKCWHPTVLRLKLPPHPKALQLRWELILVGGCRFPATLATRPPDQAPGLLPLTLPLHSESNGEAFLGHCTKRRHMHVYTGLPSSSGKKNLPAVEELQQTQVQSLGRKIPRRRQGYPLQDSGLESSTDRGAWQSPCHRVRHG